MGNIGDTISDPIPSVGEAGTGYAGKIVNFLTEIKTRLQAKVPLASLLPGLWDMANNAIQNLQYVGLYEQSGTPTTPIGSLQRYQNNLWYVSASGAFQLTNGASLNASSVKGITGDYGSPNPAELKFVDADAEYYFYDDFSAGQWARARVRELDIAGGATSTKRVRFVWGGSTDYTLTLPAAVPGAQSLLQMSTSGGVTASNTIAQTITANEFKHTNALTALYPASAAKAPSHTVVNGGTSAAQNKWSLAATVATVYWPILLPLGSRITDYALYIKKNTSNTNTVTARIYKTQTATGSIGTETALGSGSSCSTNATGAFQMTENGLSIDISAGFEYYMVLTSGGSATPANDEVFSLELNYTRP